MVAAVVRAAGILSLLMVLRFMLKFWTQAMAWRMHASDYLWPGLALCIGFGSYALLKILREPRGRVLAVVCGAAGAAAMTSIPLLSLLLSPSRGEMPLCLKHLRAISVAMQHYRQDSGQYFPFDERGPLHSLALLYPRYVLDPRVFECPVARKTAWKRRMAATFPEGTALGGVPCYYGFTWRVSPLAESDFAIVADMPWNHAEDKSKPVGFNVADADGHVMWREGADPFCSANPLDNIFAREQGWSPDTDSYIRQQDY